MHGSPLDTNNFIVAHFNVNSILAENWLDELQSVCTTLHISVLCITESKLDDNIPNNILTLQGYHEPIRRDRTLNGRKGGGCLMYISENLIYKHRIDLQANYFEHLWVDVKLGGHNFTITCLYRPPNEILMLICLLLLFKSSILACKLYSLELKTGQCGVRDPLHL